MQRTPLRIGSRTTSGQSRVSRRGGMTLVEVLIATAILAVSLMALGRRGFVAIQAAQKGERQAAGAGIAREALDGLLAGTLAPPARETTWADQPEWVWWIEVKPSEQEGLVRLSVHVRSANEPAGTPLLSLSQLVRRQALPRLATR